MPGFPTFRTHRPDSAGNQQLARAFSASRQWAAIHSITKIRPYVFGTSCRTLSSMAQRQKAGANAKPTKASIELLSSALDRFSRSSRFPMLEHLTVRAFAKKGSRLPRVLVDRTFGELVRDGGAVVGTSRGVAGSHVTRIVEVLSSLLDGENSPEQPHQPSIGSKQPRGSRFSKEPPVRVSSVEAEIKLTKALSKLRMSPRFPPIALNRLGDYWDPEWVRAPFEEALTLAQLSQLKPQTLLEKRSFTTQKLLHLVAAIDRALSDNGVEVAGTSPPLPNPAAIEIARQSDTSNRPVISIEAWKRDLSSFPAAVGAGVVLYEQEAKGCLMDDGVAARILAEIPLRLSTREYITSVLLEEYEPAVVSSMLKTDHGTVLETAKLAYKKLDQALREIEFGAYQAGSALLAQPAMPLATLSDIFFGTSLSDTFRGSLTAVIARSLGGAPVVAFGIRPEGYWSKNPSGLERAIRLMVTGLPKSDSDLKAEAHSILPSFQFEIIADLLRPMAFFNDKSRNWAKKS